MVGLPSRQIERAKIARTIYSNVGMPTVKNFKNMVSRKIISNCPILVADISNSEKIYRTSMASQQGAK